MRGWAVTALLLLLLLLLLGPAAFASATPVVRTRDQLEMARARHAEMPLWGLVFDERENGTHAAEQLARAAAADPRDGVTLAVHASAVASARAPTPKHEDRIALNDRATRWRGRRLGASSYVPARRLLEASSESSGAGERPACSALLVHWQGEKHLARARFAELFELKFPGVPHADVCTNARSAPERALMQRLPVDPQQHTLVFFTAEKKVACVAHVHMAEEMERALDECARESGEWFSACYNR